MTDTSKNPSIEGFEDYDMAALLAGTAQQPASKGFSLKDHKALQAAEDDDQFEVVQVVDLKDLNLEKELAKQFAIAKQLLTDARYDKEIALNQKAQALNSITNILQTIIKLQQDLFNLERLKTLEDCLISTLQDFPDLKNDFLQKYETALKKAEK